MKKLLLLLTATFFFAFSSFSQILYSSTNAAGYSYTPRLGLSGTPKIAFDEVQIPANLVQGTDSVKITKVNFGIVRGPLAPAVTINFYYTVVDTNATVFDDVIQVPPVQIGSIDLPANGNSDIGGIVSFGDSINPLFSIKTDTGWLYPDAQTFFLGASFSVPDPLNGWELATPGGQEDGNDDVFWIYNADSTVPRAATFFGGPPTAPSATFYLQVYGKGFSTVPITLADFMARRSGKVNLLNWTTEQELNTRNFAVERSSDGRNFSPLGLVDAAGNSSVRRNYTFTDEHPATGINYYRLRTTDADNSSKFSPIRSIRNMGIADVSVYPNPATSHLTVAINADKATAGQVTITDGAGMIVYSKSVKLPSGSTQLPVSISNIAAGSYVMKIQLDDDIIIKKFNKL